MKWGQRDVQILIYYAPLGLGTIGPGPLDDGTGRDGTGWPVSLFCTRTRPVFCLLLAALDVTRKTAPFLL